MNQNPNPQPQPAPLSPPAPQAPQIATPQPPQSTPPQSPAQVPTIAKPLVEKQGEHGRPAYSEEQYIFWLDQLRPFLEMAGTLYYATKRAGIEQQYDTIRKKYQMKDWFFSKVEAYRMKAAENSNHASVVYLNKIADKIIGDQFVSKEELDYFKWWNTTHRTGQRFFVTRVEQVQKDDTEVGKVLDQQEVADMDKLFLKQTKNGGTTPNTTSDAPGPGVPTGASK